jgi:glutaredoxin 3
MTVQVYTRSQCTYCTAAKQLLNTKNIAFEEISLDDMTILEDFKVQYPGVRQVPQIIINGERIGGYQELKNFDLTTLS